MRLILALLLAASPASAWEFYPRPVCMIAHEGSGVEIIVSHDLNRPEPYTITIRRNGGWVNAPIFALRFDPVGPTISTNRHQLSDDKLSVADSGFGNVLNGLSQNRTVTLLNGDTALPVPLDGAAAAVEAFLSCLTAPTA